jgi:membrane-associated protease RseP (regulator of RpoE activity)
MLWKSFATAAFFGLVCAGSLSAEDQAGSSKTEHKQHHIYLGIKVQAMRPGMNENLPQGFRAGQGVFVAGVAPSSPAAKAGLKSHDIIMSFDDQKIFSPQQFVGLVRSDKSGREVELTVLRDGKPEQIKVTLGSQQVAETPHSASRGGAPESAKSSEGHANENAAADETFDSMVLQKVGKDKFKVEIQYLDKSGKLEKHQFEGTLKDLHQKIVSEKDLPRSEREQLLRSLNLSQDEIPIPAISWRIVPSNANDQSDGVF